MVLVECSEMYCICTLISFSRTVLLNAFEVGYQLSDFSSIFCYTSLYSTNPLPVFWNPVYTTLVMNLCLLSLLISNVYECVLMNCFL